MRFSECDEIIQTRNSEYKEVMVISIRTDLLSIYPRTIFYKRFINHLGLFMFVRSCMPFRFLNNEPVTGADSRHQLKFQRSFSHSSEDSLRLYKDDGLGIIKAQPRTVEAIKMRHIPEIRIEDYHRSQQ